MGRKIAIGCTLALVGCEPAALVPDDGRCGPPADAEALPAGGWLVEGDILVPGDPGMSEETVSGGPGFRSAVKCEGALDRVWDVGRKLALTYCLGEFRDATLQAQTERALVPATGQWERAAGINFIHRRELDGTPACAAPGAVAFVIREGDTARCGARGCPLAAASFPPDAGDDAAMVVYPEALQSELYTLETVLLHELGHLLGLVHEHSRFEQEKAICVDAASTEFRGLTFPDPASVMGDARCPGISPVATRGKLSAGDRLGAWILYGLPRARVDFDGDRRHDLLWFSPGGRSYTVWFGEPGGQFAGERHELCEGTGSCAAPRTWRPIALRGADGRSEVLMFGPGETGDERWRPRRRAAFERTRVEAESTAVPVVGAFGAGGAEAVWWLQPGEASELWWEWAADRSIRVRQRSGTIAGFGWPLVGRWLPGGPEQVLWLDAQRTTAALRAIGPGPAGMSDRAGLPACGLAAGREQVPLVGDFDGDGLDEALWWEPREEVAVRWEVARLWEGVGCEVGASRIAGAGGIAARPVIGDFDGDGADEVLWASAGQVTTWRLRGAQAEVGGGPPLDVDATGCVGDFDGDGCDDVLWFAPGQEDSPLWRARCDGDMRFETGRVRPPEGAYPVGCG